MIARAVDPTEVPRWWWCDDCRAWKRVEEDTAVCGHMAWNQARVVGLSAESADCKEPCGEPIVRWAGGLWEHVDPRLDQDHIPEPEPEELPTLEMVSLPWTDEDFPRQEEDVKLMGDFL